MGDPAQVVWDDEQKAAPAAAPSSVQWDDAGKTPAPAAVNTQSQGQIDRVMGPQSMAGQLGQQAKHLSNYVPDIGTLARETSAAGSTVKSLFDPRTYYHMAADKADDYSSRTGIHEDQDTMNKIGPAGRVITRAVLEPVAAAASDYGLVPESLGGRGFGRSHVAPQITTENALDVAPEATGTAGGAVIGGRLMQSAGNAAKIAGVKAGALPEATPRIPISDDIAGGAPKAAFAAGVRTAARSGAPIIEAVTDPLSTLKKGGKYVADKLSTNFKDYGLTPDQQRAEYLTKSAKGVDGLQKNVDALQAKVDIAKKTSSGYVPQELTDALTKATDDLHDKMVERARINSKNNAAVINSPETSVMYDKNGNEFPVQRGNAPVDSPKIQQLEGQQQDLPLTMGEHIGPNIAESAKAPAATPDISQQWTTPEVQDITSGIKRVGRAGESKAAQASFGDAENHSLGQFARVNGPRIDAAVPNTPEGQTLANHIHSMTGTDIGKVAKDFKIEPEYKEGKGGKQSLDRAGTFNKFLDAGKSPEDIVNSHYKRLANPPSVGGGSQGADNPRVQTVESSVSPKQFLDKVAPGQSLEHKLNLDRATGKPIPDISKLIEQYKNDPSKVPTIKIQYDASGNLIGADGIKRAMAAQKAGVERIKIKIERNAE